MTDDKYSRLMQMDIISTKSYNTVDKASIAENKVLIQYIVSLK